VCRIRDTLTGLHPPSPSRERVLVRVMSGWNPPCLYPPHPPSPLFRGQRGFLGWADCEGVSVTLY
jgi:hypothetical protein